MTRNTDQDVAFIRALADLMRESDLSEIEVEREYGDDDELKVRLTRQGHEALPVPVQQVAVPTVPVAAPPPGAPAPQPTTAEPEGPEPVRSPMVGTVYLAAEPGAEPFVRVGDTVAEGDTLLIIEAMKTMNQIPSPVSGTVREVLVGNAEPVEYGAALVRVT
ncbi:MAG: acetyl-CoA carboxylase biotin carboxyl carrier protein [Pseudomonadota bacterium]